MEIKSNFEEWGKGAGRVKPSKDLNEALQEADLIIEALPENLELKRKMFAQVNSLAPEGAILATTSSSLPISKIESVTKRPVFPDGQRKISIFLK